ncbi:hypothetical protein Patl1_21928 [Pistacia atlantica]|uniref:Uncharacterized protein n=1 Tax=Pistacia atlantica TaxID=434234 RepID=A0ACC1BMB8_9ROSI|nr:hypothetical protein Patl1_21928 [Pistacia atlantica]
MAQDTRDVASGSQCDPSRCLNAKHFRYLFQDSYCSWHGFRHPSLQGARQTPRPLSGYILETFVHKVTGESHARPPTESRPGHVALIAGFYEDPSAVTKDGKLIQLNLIQFLIKASVQFLMVAQILFRYFVEPCHTAPKILIPMTMKTLQLVRSVNFCSQGDGHPTNTDTPLIVWGADVNYPKPLSETNHSDCGFRFVDEHALDTPTPKEWSLDGIERVDVNQADIAPIMTEKVEARLANTNQILNQFLRKSRILFIRRLLDGNLDCHGQKTFEKV